MKKTLYFLVNTKTKKLHTQRPYLNPGHIRLKTLNKWSDFVVKEYEVDIDIPVRVHDFKTFKNKPLYEKLKKIEEIKKL